MATAIPANVARARLGTLLRQAAQKRARFLITKSGKPTAVLLSISDFDDMLEELDPEFRQTLRLAAREYRSGKVVNLREYVRRGFSSRRTG